MTPRVILSILALVVLPGSCFSQQPSLCRPVDIPVSVITADGRVVRGLTAERITVQVGTQTLAVESLSYNTAPRRILFVLDSGHVLPSDARKAEAKMVGHILTSARPEDSFALLTARGALRHVRFNESRETLTAVVNELSNGPQERGSKHGVLDAVMEGIGWFGDSRTGDTIVVMAEGIEKQEPEQDQVSYSAVARALAEHHIRLFGVQLGPIVVGFYTTELSTNYRGQLTAGGTSFPNEESLTALTWNSGGYMVVENTKDPWKEYKLTDSRLQHLQQEAWRIYGAIAEFYQLQLQIPVVARRETFRIDLAEKTRQKVPQAKILYPHAVGPCPSAEPHR